MRKFTALLLGKIILKILRTAKLGGGSAAPGLYGLKIHPGLIEDLTSKIPQNIIITGTNGKTTTSRLIAYMSKANTLKVIRNSTGSNLERGIASALIHKSSFLNHKSFDLGIWEVDEAAFNTIIFKIKPQIIVFLNAFRDQLDRYGEVDTIIKKWSESLKKTDWNPLIIVNASDPKLADFVPENLQKSYFSISSQNLLWEGSKKPVTLKADFEAFVEKNKIDHTSVLLKYPGGKIKANIPMPGIFNVFNFLASFAVSYQLNMDIVKSINSLKGFLPAFGRFEKLKLGKNEAFIFLIKNPAGATEVFQTIAPHLKKEDRILLALNDNFADGKDVSWIWDSRFEELRTKNYKLSTVSSGTRAYDLAVRLKYAGFDTIAVESDLKKAFKSSQRGLKGNLYILPTYTAMLSLQKILTETGIKKHYWEEK